MDLKLYGGKLSPFVMRPVLAARAKGHELEPGTFEGGIKCEAYLALSPMGKMPLLVHGDFALPESQPITDYLDSILTGPALTPADAKEAARTRLIVRLADLNVVPHLGGIFRARENPEAVGPALAGLAEGIAFIEHYRRDSDVFVVGDSFTVADAALLPLFFFLDAFHPMMKTGDLISAHPRLAAWWERAKASELGSRCIAEQAAGLKAMMGG